MDDEPDPAATASPEPGPGDAPRGLRRVAVLVGACVVLGLVARLSGLTHDLTVAGIRAHVQAAGHWGWLLYAALFCGSYLATVPGMPFVAAAVAAYGPVEGGLLGYGAALLAASCNFWAGRRLGGGSRPQVRWRLVQRLLDHLEERPVRTIALARLVMMLTPPFDYGLGLTEVSYARYLCGSALGLVPPVLAVALFLDRLLAWWGA